jgi:hypothetical protein
MPGRPDMTSINHYRSIDSEPVPCLITSLHFSKARTALKRYELMGRDTRSLRGRKGTVCGTAISDRSAKLRAVQVILAVQPE